eukprot:2605-Heterococcus_DN1.PRE.4
MQAAKALTEDYFTQPPQLKPPQQLLVLCYQLHYHNTHTTAAVQFCVLSMNTQLPTLTVSGKHVKLIQDKRDAERKKYEEKQKLSINDSTADDAIMDAMGLGKKLAAQQPVAQQPVAQQPVVQQPVAQPVAAAVAKAAAQPQNKRAAAKAKAKAKTALKSRAVSNVKATNNSSSSSSSKSKKAAAASAASAVAALAQHAKPIGKRA